jgi:hypothetical protein
MPQGHQDPKKHQENGVIQKLSLVKLRVFVASWQLCTIQCEYAQSKI